jgi:hypothetical protein
MSITPSLMVMEAEIPDLRRAGGKNAAETNALPSPAGDTMRARHDYSTEARC